MYSRVKVYRNLHKKCWSVASLQKPNYGIIVGHENTIVLKNCTFKVSEKSRQRVIKEKRKNVHAWVIGHGFEVDLDEVSIDFLKPAYYNPYITDSFIDFETKKKVEHADFVLFTDDLRVYYI